jgi:hypothetical protein
MIEPKARYEASLESLHRERRLEGVDCYSRAHKRALKRISRRVSRNKRAAQAALAAKLREFSVPD